MIGSIARDPATIHTFKLGRECKLAMQLKPGQMFRVPINRWKRPQAATTLAHSWRENLGLNVFSSRRRVKGEAIFWRPGKADTSLRWQDADYWSITSAEPPRYIERKSIEQQDVEAMEVGDMPLTYRVEDIGDHDTANRMVMRARYATGHRICMTVRVPGVYIFWREAGENKYCSARMRGNTKRGKYIPRAKLREMAQEAP